MRHGHRHAEWEFNLVTRGRGAYVIDGRRVELALDSILWLLPSHSHVLLDRSSDFEMWVAVARPRLIRALAADAPFAAWRSWFKPSKPLPAMHRVMGESHTERLVGLLERLAGPRATHGVSATLSPEHESSGLSFLFAEAWLTYASARDLPTGSHLHPAVQGAVEWLADHAHTPQADDLDALADRLHVSRPHLSRLFKDQTGQTLTAFRHRRRVDRLLSLIGRGGRMNLTEAAYAAGFGSYAQAYRVVKRATGKSPKHLVAGD
ncbi:MAG: AraC family transcriptional regulator [Planctomycetota bacterium]